MTREETLPNARGVGLAIDKLADLLVHREPIGLASEALSTLIADFGATAASLFYAARPPLSVRKGSFAPAISAHLDQWEEAIEVRISSGAWPISERKAASLAVQPIRDTGLVAAHALMVDEGKVVGTLSLVYDSERLPSGNQRRLLSRFVRAVGRAVNLAAELILTKERLGQLTLFYQVAQSMASTFDLAKVLDDTMQLATAILDASVSALMLVDEEHNELVFEYTHGELGDLLHNQRIGLDEGIAGWVAAHGEPVVVNEVRADSRFSPQVEARTGFHTESIVCVPIQIRGRTIGVLLALNKRNELEFDSEDLSLMVTTANQAAVAIENAQLYQSLRDERDRVIHAQETVRRQVARNLHDGTVQFLSAISMGIDHLERLLEFKPEAAKSELQALRDLTRQATQQARLALFELRPVILETQGLVAALETYVEQLQSSEKFGVHLQAPASMSALDASVAGTVFSIVQEAVTNAKKHAAPHDIWLRVSQDSQCLRVVIEDNGTGFDQAAVEETYDQSGSIGLLNMRERAELIEGLLMIESCTTSPRSGTRVILRVPTLRNDEQELTDRQEEP